MGVEHTTGYFSDAIAFSPVRDMKPWRPGNIASFKGGVTLFGSRKPSYAVITHLGAAICVDVTGPLAASGDAVPPMEATKAGGREP